MRSFFLPLLALVSLASAACTTPARIRPPDGFAELGSHEQYDFRAASAQGVVVAVRTENNKLHATSDFWADSIDVRMRRDGYRGEKVLGVVSANGVQGKQMRYSRESDRRTYRYWLTVFATEDRVYVVEAGGDQESFDPAERVIESSVLSLRAR